MDSQKPVRDPDGGGCSSREERGGAHEGDIARCFACGTCVSGCPVHAQRPEFDPRKIIRMTLLGLEKELMESGVIWLCSTCYTCVERCPQNVGCAHLILELRRREAKAGRTPDGVRMQREALARFGRVYEIEEFDNKRRQKMGLVALESRAAAAQTLALEPGEEAPQS